MKAAIKWTVAKGSNPQGHPTLHLHFARHYAGKQEYIKASRHYLRCPEENAVTEHGQLVIEWSKKGFRGEVDLFITRVVLQYLCLQDLKSANQIFLIYCTHYKYVPLTTDEKDRKSYESGDVESSVLDTPLIHFLEFLLRTVERDAESLFYMLRQKYQLSIGRDPQFKAYLDKIGEVYFHIPAPKGMLDSLLAPTSTTS